MDAERIVKKAARQLKIDENTACLYFDTFVATVSEELQKGNDVSLPEFGEFCLEMQDEIPARVGGEPSGAKKAVRKIVFVPSGRLEDYVNRW